MLRQQPKQLSFHASLYNKIPENHMLKIIEKAVDFSFINELLKDSYCQHFGRPAKEPEMMCKLLFLQRLYDLSDDRLIEESSMNLVHLYFLGLNPEDALPDKSLLSKFRTQRLEESTLDSIITEIVRQCVDQGIIKSDAVSIDATHIEANTKRQSPEKLMVKIGRKIIRSYEDESGKKLEGLPEEPEYTQGQDHENAKAEAMAYLTTVMKKVNDQGEGPSPRAQKMVSKAQEIMSDPKFLMNKGMRSLVDEDARVGRKSKEDTFYGYKSEFMMTSAERIITSAKTADGAYVDGSLFEEMLEETVKAGINPTEIFADKAYFRKPILDAIKTQGSTAYIPVSKSVYRMDESQFSYNKDADQWECRQGNQSEKKKHVKTKRGSEDREAYKYYFNLKQCKQCPLHDACAKKSGRKILMVGMNTNEYYELSQAQKSDEFKEKYKQRALIEGKNAELKRFHGLYRARGYGLESVSKQTKLTAIAANLKRIAAIAGAMKECFSNPFSFLYII